MSTYYPYDDDTAKSLLGEGFHTAFRKGLPDSEHAHGLWKAIQELPAEEWDAVLDYVVWGLGHGGIKLCREDWALSESERKSLAQDPRGVIS